jgi:Glycosyltransferase family 87
MESSAEWKPWQIRAILWLTVCLTLPCLIFLHHGIGAGDSTMFRVGATLFGPDLYRHDLQAKLLGSHDTPFFRAPFYAWMLRPLLRFNFALALFLLNLAATAAVILLLPRTLGKYRYGLSPLVVLFIPLALNFSVEQDGALVLLILSLSLISECAGLSFLAGVILALTLEKPSLFLLLPVVVAVQKRFQMLWGYVTCACVLAIVSFWVVGLPGVKDYINLVAQYSLTLDKMPTARGIAANLHLSILWPLLTALAAAATLWRARTASFRAAFCIGIVGSLFVSPQSYAHDCAILLLPVLYFLFNGSPVQWGVSALWLVPIAPLAYLLPAPWSAGTALLVLLLLCAVTIIAVPAGTKEGMVGG